MGLLAAVVVSSSSQNTFPSHIHMSGETSERFGVLTGCDPDCITTLGDNSNNATLLQTCGTSKALLDVDASPEVELIYMTYIHTYA